MKVAKKVSVLLLLMMLASQASAQFTLTLLHNNDGESQLIDAGTGLEDFGGVARFKTLADHYRASDDEVGGVIVLTSGDNFLAGPEFNAGVDAGVYYDAKAQDYIGYDVLCLGNHDFDFGPETLAGYISGFSMTQPTFLSSNLDFSGESSLQALVNSGRIAAHTIIEVDDEEIGIIGATTPMLPFISSPGDVAVDADVAGAIQAEVTALTNAGVNKIILISHLQGIEEDLALLPSLSGIDLVVAGGGDELLANDGDLLIPGDEEQVFGAYPMMATDSEDNEIPVVTTRGNYTYLGRIQITFDENGVVTSISDSSGPVRVAGGDNEDAVEADEDVMDNVVTPVIDYLESLATTIIAESEVVLDGRRSMVRAQETNEGNLIADSQLWYARSVADEYDVPSATVALQNGGGIRNDTEIPAGGISELETFNIAPFDNFICVVPDVPASEFKRILENAVSAINGDGSGTGRFAQIAGFTFTYDATQQAMSYDDEGNVTAEGERIVDVELADGTMIISEGEVVNGAPAIHIATINFLANGGDQYPFGDADYTILGATYQQSLSQYIQAEDGLNGSITAEAYPVGGEERIVRLDAASVSDNYLSLPSSIELNAAYPNPFNPSTLLPFTLPASGKASLHVYDMLGRQVAVLVNGNRPAGSQQVVFNATGLASGTYIVTLRSQGQQVSQKIHLVK